MFLFIFLSKELEPEVLNVMWIFSYDEGVIFQCANFWFSSRFSSTEEMISREGGSCSDLNKLKLLNY